MDDIKILLDYVFVPLVYLLFRQNQRITVLEAQQIKKDDLEKIYTKLDDIKDNFIHVNTCNANHKKES